MSEDNILGAILAGGQSKRMGKDKLFLEFDNKKLSTIRTGRSNFFIIVS